jgi:hypothetical protein
MRSSIFSSEQLRRYAALPAAQRRWHALVVAVLGVVALVSSQMPRAVYGSAGCGPDSLGRAAVGTLSDQTEVLFLGSSHVLFGVRPQKYSVRATNLAATWLDYSCLRRVLEKHLPRVPAVKVAVIEFDELPLVSDLVPALLATRDLRPLTELELTPLEVPTAGWAQRAQAIWTAWSFPVTGLPRVTPLGWVGRDSACNPLYRPPRGFAPGYFYTDAVTPPTFDAKLVFDVLSAAAGHEDIVQRNFRDLQESVAQLRRRGVAVVLLRLPHNADYARGRPDVLLARWRQLQEWARTDPSLIVLDWGERSEFQAADFCDIHHLNATGADKLARLLDPQLRALCRRSP